VQQGRARVTRILALDASGAHLSVAVWDDGTVWAHHDETLARGHAERLPPALAATVAAAGLTFADLDALAVTTGPGSFTGIRVGLAAARGLGFALKIPVVGITSFASVAHALDEELRAGRPVLVLLDSKRADVFAQRFAADLVPVGEPCALPLESVAAAIVPPLVVTGDAATLVAAGPEIAVVPAVPDARVMARLAASYFAAGIVPPAEPLYLRPPDATVPVAGGRLAR
jgi:tRNA threonylcarbamoyladenosine biosynthesis protein TsaB